MMAPPSRIASTGRLFRRSISKSRGQSGSTRRVFLCSNRPFINVLVFLVLGGLTLLNDRKVINVINLKSSDNSNAESEIVADHNNSAKHMDHQNRSQESPVAPTLLKEGAAEIDRVQHDSYNSTFHSPVMLDLLPWELQSIREYSNVSQPNGFKVVPLCHPPDGIPETCCLGSVSTRGSMIRSNADICFKGDDVYRQVEQAARQELQRTASLVVDATASSSEECDVCRILNLVYQYDLKLALTGDSMMLQTFSGFWCEMSRRGYRVSNINTTYHSFHPSFVGIRGFTILEITGPVHWVKPVHVTFFSQYMPQENMSEIRQMAATYDVVVMNFGIHWSWRRRQNFRSTMLGVFNAFRESGSTVRLLAYRETSAQHFDGPAGEWADYTRVFPCYPWPKNGTSPQVRWREKIVQNMATRAGLKIIVADETLAQAERVGAVEKELVILPFYDFTIPLHYLHPGECTHYCSTPFMWMPVWRSLRLAMDRRWVLLGKSESTSSTRL